MKTAAARIIDTAIRLQSSRTLKRDITGLAGTFEGQEFAKAISDGAAAGLTPQEVVGEVLKAMGGDEGKALEILTSVEELAKAHVEQHTRTLANGKTVNVKAYEVARTASMKGTTLAHGATFRAMKDKTPEAHENAARMHEEAAKQHGEAHGLHPMDVPEVGQEHASLKGQHQMAAEYHKGEAATLRNGEEYQRAKGKADVASNLSTQAGTGKEAAPRHREAAALHQKAHDLSPAAGHDSTAGKHEALAAAHSALDQSLESPHRSKARYDAQDASAVALHATQQAHTEGATHEAHAKAMQAHGKAAEAHMALHGALEDDEDGHHGKIAREHMKAHSYHDKRSRPNESAEAAAKWKKDQPVAKAEGPMTITPTTTDLAEKKGGEALAVEGRPKEDEEEEVGKAIVSQHTREVGGKIVQVSSYDNHHQAAMQASGAAHTATGAAKNPQAHASAAAAHKKAAEGHKEAAKYAPEEWIKKGHEDNAKLHEHYAQAHHAKAKAADLKADTGVDTPQHTAQDIKELENHDHYQGFGYHGHSNRTEITDEQVAEAANRANLDKHELAAHLLSKSGRHMMDGHDGGTDHETAIANFQRHLSDPKNAKTYGIKDYAKELEEKAGKGEAKETAKPVTKITNDGLTHAQRTAGASKDPEEKARFHAANHDSEVAYASGSKEYHAKAHKSHSEALAQATTPEIKAYHEKYAGIHGEKMAAETAKEPEGKADKDKPAVLPQKKSLQTGAKTMDEINAHNKAATKSVLEHHAKKAAAKNEAGGIDHLSIAKKHMGQDLETLDERKSDRLDFHDISKTAASRMVADAFKQGSGGKEPTEEQTHAAYQEAMGKNGGGFDHLKDEGRDHLDFKEHHVSAIKDMIETGHKHGKAAK